jgi:CheY-like chemotaxis protein
MSGLDLAREVKRISDLPVVLMSGFSAQVSEDEARRAGVKTFLRKPVGSGELRSVLAELV